MKKIVLASASPRRYELLKQLDLDFEVLPSDVDEDINLNTPVEDLVGKLSFAKANSIAGKLGPDHLVIGADTLVVKDGCIFGKPRDTNHARDMLKMLGGSWHEVITGIAVIDTSVSRAVIDYEKTFVKMRSLSDDMINSYIRTGEPLDKAGAYGIQGMGAILVEKIDGCYFNVVGLPLAKLGIILEEFGIPVFQS